MKVWERRLMKDFKVAPVASEEDEELLTPPPENEDPLARFRRIAKMAVLNSGIYKWRQVVEGAQIASQIGHCHDLDSYKKQQNLQKAIEEAQRLTALSLENPSRAITPIYMPDLTGSDIIDLIRGEDESEPACTTKRIALSPNVITLRDHKLPTTPRISIDLPRTSLKRQQTVPSAPKPEEPDLINLESAKSSPLPSNKISGSASSPNSLDQKLNASNLKSCDPTKPCTCKTITSPSIAISSPQESNRRRSCKNAYPRDDSLYYPDDEKNRNGKEFEQTKAEDMEENSSVVSKKTVKQTETVTDDRKQSEIREGEAPVEENGSKSNRIAMYSFDAFIL
ncbi:hypothetical protein NQ318_012587 [Aromia moschata]|uniref:Uncharacterized protein n=1 Tax=Aromia moschata TaxID=1265417 RepID=A0AAV8YLW9_9CUCU|nr:hypothetical protein NQ318_012587 [Aromia moschata]